MTDRHYDVGFKKLPRHTRFKKGQSGNPRGKAKGRKDLKTGWSLARTAAIAPFPNKR
jgi:hypothetical protein